MKVLLAVIIATLVWLTTSPVPIEPVAWDAPLAPALEGPYAANDRLAAVRRVGRGVGLGPEDVEIARDGTVYVGYEDGRIARFVPGLGSPEVFARTGGRPLGLELDPSGRLVVCDGHRGLLRVATDGTIEVLAAEADGLPFGFTNDLDIAADGTIYFTDASWKFGPEMKARDDVLEHGGNGRLMKYDPATGGVTVLLDGLQFANGVALAPDGNSLLVAQTGSYNVLRYWLAGERAGTHEIFIDNLPGIPDGISSNGRDTYWLALFTVRNPMLDAMSGLPWLRKVVYRMPQFLQPQPAPHAFVLGLSLDGEVTHNLQHDGSGSFAPVTSVTEAGGRLYLGSLTQDAFGVLKLPQL
ncbi:MAG: SMP-30/gluconolactonase/LRE family protein [Gammaproteobacteria bacterium]|jgi:sugar lactone lactonase YvrE